MTNRFMKTCEVTVYDVGGFDEQIAAKGSTSLRPHNDVNLSDLEG